MPTQSKLLTKLQERQDKLNAQIKAAKAKEAKKQTAIQNNRARIIGQAVTDEMKDNEQLQTLVNTALNTRVTNTKERKILELEPLPKEK